MRVYQPLWYLLRKHKDISFRADPIHHRHIIRMVSKEKYEDTYFAKGLRTSGKRAWLTVHIHKDTVTIKLHTTASCTDLGLDDIPPLPLSCIPNIRNLTYDKSST